jgi:hypothetical protein
MRTLKLRAAASTIATALALAGLACYAADRTAVAATTPTASSNQSDVDPSRSELNAAADFITSRDAVLHNRMSGSVLVSDTELRRVAISLSHPRMRTAAGAGSTPIDASTSVVPLDSGDHCNQSTCENVKSQGGSGPYITYWKIWTTQPGGTNVCTVVGNFLKDRYTDLADAVFSGCSYVPPGYSREWYGFYPGISGTDPQYFAPGTQLCATWHPNPPLPGLPCITVGS